MPKKPNRPYFSASIEHLENLYATRGAELSVLRAIAQELSHRQTARAAVLNAKVAQNLADASTSKPDAKPSARSGTPATSFSLTSQVGTPATPTHNTARGSAAAIPHADENPTPPTTPSAPSAPAPSPETPPLPSPDQMPLPSRILAAWTALEALSPQAFKKPEDLANGDRSCIASLDRSVPWELPGEKGRPKTQLYYQIVLGAISMTKATDAMVAAFGESDEQPSCQGGHAAIATLLVDRHGILLAENCIGLSSFAWALPLALQQRLEILGGWACVERQTTKALEEMLSKTDEDGAPLPLTQDDIMTAFGWLTQHFAIPGDMAAPPTFAVRVYHYYKALNPPEPLLLNSFFLHDLGRCLGQPQQGDLPKGLRRYLGVETPQSPPDLLTDTAALEQAISPAMMPPARWPSPGGHPLVTLQQAAVNLATQELDRNGGILAVNGPPGTGKTTLLRDVVAACVFGRAVAMANFDNPASAFTPSGQKIAFGGGAFYHLYHVDSRLKGHEILVASSNNKAVENISRELPALSAIGRAPDELRYFKTTSDRLQQGSTGGNPWDGNSAPATPGVTAPVETWGLIAAVLGNRTNCAAFQKGFWWDKDCGLAGYLKTAAGKPQQIPIQDPKTGNVIGQRSPRVVEEERPPTPQLALAQWKSCKARFLALKKDVENELASLEQVRLCCLRIPAARTNLAQLRETHAQLAARHGQAAAFRDACIANADAARQAHERQASVAQHHRLIRPGFFSRLFRTERWKQWATDNDAVLDAVTEALVAVRETEQERSQAVSALNSLVEELRAGELTFDALARELSELERQVASWRSTLGERLVDEHFFRAGHDAINLAAPWIPASLHKKREDLFIAALDVHRAFIDVSAQKLLHNIGVLTGFMSGPVQDPAKRALLGDLWSSLFMVVPVVSSTFASVERMLCDLPPESFGWLLIDEAGQATPQAAAGAILRAQRTIVVGDPMQVPPVVTLPQRLVENVCRHFHVDPLQWAAPEASAQILADRASDFQAAFAADPEPRRVGVPLLVHRRCQNPMFEISNRIAYDGQMVHAPTPCRACAVADALGPSCWLDISSPSSAKWSPAEGDMAYGLLQRLADAGIADPDAFIITPFRNVSNGLRTAARGRNALFAALRANPKEWAERRIGTIHTFQGREADTVIFVLGAPGAAEVGARMWAGNAPNILNVAVSRAKRNLYVIGSYDGWSRIGHFAALADALPRVRT
ncbi:DEAD/DEAH box helicase [Nitratidesulfovibrio sp. 1201_IL3209]|uniref:DEAD/DEAH box helicase n=1 Tax=Nitratidesulfovibrio sp. 1201_IL3209 TaxID=3084053 RepID=UPI002FD9C6C5